MGSDIIGTCIAVNEVFGINLLEGLKKHRDWVARIVGLDPQYGFQREFVQGKKDYAHSNSKGTRGVYINYILDEGFIYEVSAPQSWKRTDRYFCRVVSGEITKISKEDVEEWLNSHSE